MLTAYQLVHDATTRLQKPGGPTCLHAALIQTICGDHGLELATADYREEDLKRVYEIDNRAVLYTRRISPDSPWVFDFGRIEQTALVRYLRKNLKVRVQVGPSDPCGDRNIEVLTCLGDEVIYRDNDWAT